MSWRRFLKAQRVLVVVTETGFICCWRAASDDWRWRTGHWSADCCREGIPLQREAMGELLADLLLDCDVIGAEIELILPLAACHWRVLEGVPTDGNQRFEISHAFRHNLHWPLEREDTYVSLSSCGDCLLAVGVARTLLQAWIDVVEFADLPLRRVEWILSSALRGLQLFLPEGVGDLAWLIQASQNEPVRLLLLRSGVPDVDRPISSDQPIAGQIRNTVRAWQSLVDGGESLAWCCSVIDQSVLDGSVLVDTMQLENVLQPEMTWIPSPWSPDLEQGELDPLVHLALAGVREVKV